MEENLVLSQSAPISMSNVYCGAVSSNFIAKIYLILAVPTLVLLCFLTQPLHSLDEPAHFLRVVQLSSGDVFPVLGPDRESTGSYEASGTRKFATYYGVVDQNYKNPKEKTSLPELMTLYDIRNDKGYNEYIQHSNTTIYFPLAYAAPIAAVSAARLITDRPLIWFYAGRLASALLGAGLTYLVLRQATRGRFLFFAVAMLPITLFQTAAFSADSLLIPAAMALTSMVAHIIEGRSLSTAECMTAAIAGAFVGLGKIAYLPLVAILPLVAALVRRRLDRTVVGIVLGAASIVVIWLLWSAEVHDFVFTTRQDDPGGLIDVQAQLALIFSQPLVFVKALLFSLRPYAPLYFISFSGGLIGWVDIWIPRPITYLNFVVLTAALVLDFQRLSILMIVRAGAYLACIMSALAVFLLLYLQWNAVGANYISGVQGRYFLPLLPFACVVTPSLMLSIEKLRLFSRGLTAWGCLSATVTIISVVRRYWI